MPNFSLENSLSHSYEQLRIAGIDEVGCGPWAGPLIAAACFLDQSRVPYHILQHMDDSKKLSPVKRLKAFELLMNLSQDDADALDFGIGSVSVAELDNIGLSQAIKLAMHRAVTSLNQKPDHLLIDGNRNPHLGIPTTMIVKGDSISYSIAAASIIAKITRDRIMTELHVAYPAYKWCTNSGYGTKEHMNALSNHGVTIHHRKSYAPIKKLITPGV